MSTAPYPTIRAKIICDSIGRCDTFFNGEGEDAEPELVAPRLTTFEVTYNRYIHAELMTNRMFSRNAQSSRAIPVQRRLKRVRENPVMPIRWGANQRGMQAQEVEVDDLEACKAAWLAAATSAADAAERLMDLGLHKQWANRVLEPFDTITTIVTATNYENSFALRCDPDAQPEYHNLAWKMADLYYNSEPTVLRPGEWHLPYVNVDEEMERWSAEGVPYDEIVKVLVKASVARCARVSYLNHDGSSPDLTKDIALHERLLADGHMSPFEHQAEVAGTRSRTDFASKPPPWHGNLAYGWIQYRKLLPREVRTFNYDAAVDAGERPWTEPYTGPEEV